LSGIPVVLVVAIAFACLFVGGWLGRMLTRYPWGEKPYTGMEQMIDRTATVVQANEKDLVVRYNNLLWSSDLVDDSNVSIGDKVVIVKVSGNRLSVKKF
jgi:membrane protein implicated in regulation of membrane protease activity